ncbi:30S ribosomal protein S19e [Candidatus Woesearchaeota archaeon]|nr:30S ribosomal protein S19e [Candidatus Woesearchaeota archaeon]
MAVIYDADINKSIEKLGQELKSVLKAPEWTLFAKTGAGKERPPVNPDWFYIRAAAVLRTVYMRGPIGVEKLRIKYGNKKNQGHRPEEFRKGAGKILRNALQQLESAGLVKFQKDGVNKGRIITSKGKALMDKCAVREWNKKE